MSHFVGPQYKVTLKYANEDIIIIFYDSHRTEGVGGGRSCFENIEEELHLVQKLQSNTPSTLLLSTTL